MLWNGSIFTRCVGYLGQYSLVSNLALAVSNLIRFGKLENKGWMGVDVAPVRFLLIFEGELK
jgi:hypothetical protein